MALVTDVIAPRRGSKRRVVELDHAPWRDTSAEVLAALGIRAGHIAPEDEIGAALDAEEPVRARERAIRLLAYRERSVTELRSRLVDDGYPEEVAARTVGDLERIGLVDDERFAGSLARVLTGVRGMGRSRALRELAAKGVDPEMAREALDENLTPEDEHDHALELARAVASRPGASFDRVAARLARKGYSVSVSLRATREAFDEITRDAHLDPDQMDCDE
jgi:regulatory protein